MNLQYINDEEGNTTGVFIPIKEWNLLKDKYHFEEEVESFTSDQVKELNSRVDSYLQNPNDLVEWSDVKKRLHRRKNEI